MYILAVDVNIVSIIDCWLYLQIKNSEELA